MYALVAIYLYSICSFERAEQFAKIYKYVMNPVNLQMRISTCLALFFCSSFYLIGNFNWNSKIIGKDSRGDFSLN